MPEQNLSISSFRQFLLRMLLPLIFILSAAGLVFNYFFEEKVILNSQLCGAYKVNRIIKETHPNEIPIFGSSRAEYGLFPDSLGKDFFNYGLSAAKYDVVLFFLEQECKKTKASPYIILNFDLDGMTYSLGDIANYVLNANEPDVKKLLGNEYKYYFNIPFIKYYGRYESYLRLYFSNKMELTQVTNKGAALDKNMIPQKEFIKLVNERKNTTQTFKNELLLQKKLMDIINAHPERYFIFVIAPYHPSYFVNFTNLDSANAYLDRLRSLKNTKVFDFSKMPLEDSMFLNTTHVNYKGAMIYNHQFRNSLMSIGVH